MPKKKEEAKVTKKVKEDLTSDIIDEINNSVKEEITEEIVSDIKKTFDNEYKEEIKTEIKSEIISDIKKDISKEQKKLGRYKSFKIFRLYIYLLIVVAFLVYLLVKLYQTDNLDVIDKRYTKKHELSTTIIEDQELITTTQEVKDLAYYVKNYGSLMDSVKISNVELVKGSYTIDDINMSDRLALVYANISEDKINVDGQIHSVASNVMLEAYLNLFGSSYMSENITENFSVNGLNYVYSASNDCYMAIGEEDTSISYINNILVEAYEDAETIVFEAKAYVVKNNYIYNPLNMNYRLSAYEENMDMSRIQNRLVTVAYKFKPADDGYHLSAIEKK